METGGVEFMYLGRWKREGGILCTSERWKREGGGFMYLGRWKREGKPGVNACHRGL